MADRQETDRKNRNKTVKQHKKDTAKKNNNRTSATHPGDAFVPGWPQAIFGSSASQEASLSLTA